MSEDLRAQLAASLGSNFPIERELGGGGMSRVFLARDQALDRAVVVKVLASEVSAGISTERFRREIQLIAKLQHPHVVPILSAGAAEASLYYVMPFIAGETLRERLVREGALTVNEAVRLLREMLDALSFAHSQGVIHRDIKPENILLQAGHAIVADFGVAKALSESGTVTSAGVALGTPRYMAPEQAAADPGADHRADLYSVALVAYEMLAGTPPFSGTVHAVIRAQMTMAPVPLRQRRSDVPAPIADVIMRALRKEPSERPQSAAEIIALLDAAARPRAAVGRRAGSGARRARWLGAAAIAAAGAAGAWQFGRPPVIASAQSMAIAPFSVAASDTALERLGQNLVTTISANLDGVGDIRVADAMSVLSHARTKGPLLSVADAIAIARKLGAKSVVHGSLTPTGRTVRADAALYEVRSPATPIVRVSVAAPADSLAAMTDSLTWRLLRAVWSRGRAPTPNVTSITTHSPEALREFLEGERLFARSGMDQAAEAYKRAVAADTTFWFAYYRYAVASNWFGGSADTSITQRLRRHLEDLPERERLFVSVAWDSVASQTDRIRELNKIVARYPDFAPGLMALADYLIHSAMLSGHDVREAIEPWRRIVGLMPSDMESANHLAYACVAAGDLPCARKAYVHLDSLVRADSSPTIGARLQQRTLALVVGESTRLADSLIQAGRRDSIFPFGFSYGRLILMPATVGRPQLIAEWDRALDATRKAPHPWFGREGVEYARLIDRAVRGDWSDIDSAVASARDVPAPLPLPKVHALRMRALGELQGMIAPDRKTADAAIALGSEPGATSELRVECHWIAGLNALLRGDSVAFARHLAGLEREPVPSASIGARSLRAIRDGQRGRHDVAADSLLTLEREHGEEPPKLWSALAADRLLAAQWLIADRRYAPADSLLRFTRGMIVLGVAEAAGLIYAPALLLRSRIAEGLGKHQDAVSYATMFLNAFDLAPPSQKPLIAEAKDRIARLSRREGR